MPPSQLGMVPALLAARIAPKGVRVVPLSPNWAASSGETFAREPAERIVKEQHRNDTASVLADDMLDFPSCGAYMTFLMRKFGYGGDGSVPPVVPEGSTCKHELRRTNKRRLVS